MVKLANLFVCQSCGASFGKWAGRCESCGGWNSLVEETVDTGPSSTRPKAPSKSSRGVAFHDLQSAEPPLPRMQTAIAEFDRVCGGGVVPGSALLIGGDPGIGKSTLLLQAAAALAKSGAKVAYVSGEEAIDQIRSRARRLGLADTDVMLATETALGPILDALKREKPDFVVIDSIQTLWSDALAAAPRHGQPGARLRAGADPLCQKTRLCHRAGRSCHQGWTDCRATGDRTYGR
ncbi:MAG: AAA family ATPase [Robiginitomaculum sp.]|nr:AAA family ATPase [Robiginitomaculum sp.]